MILTDKFVFMHVPKTGGTFVTRMLRKLLTPGEWDRRVHAVGRRYRVHLPGYPYKYRELSQHAMRKRIPATHAELPIVSCVRNPYDLYVSQYTFNWWRENPTPFFVDADAVIAEFGPLEDFDFPTFVHATVAHHKWSAVCRKCYPRLQPMSYASTEWLHYHCLQPAQVVGEASSAGEFVPRARDATAGITFLRTQCLNQDLHAFLQRMGYAAQLIDPILTSGKIHPGKPRRQENDHWSNHYDDDLRRLVRQHEALLFEMFPEFDETPDGTLES